MGALRITAVAKGTAARNSSVAWAPCTDGMEVCVAVFFGQAMCLWIQMLFWLYKSIRALNYSKKERERKSIQHSITIFCVGILYRYMDGKYWSFQGVNFGLGLWVFFIIFQEIIIIIWNLNFIVNVHSKVQYSAYRNNMVSLLRNCDNIVSWGHWWLPSLENMIVE